MAYIYVNDGVHTNHTACPPGVRVQLAAATALINSMNPPRVGIRSPRPNPARVRSISRPSTNRQRRHRTVRLSHILRTRYFTADCSEDFEPSYPATLGQVHF